MQPCLFAPLPGPLIVGTQNSPQVYVISSTYSATVLRPSVEYRWALLSLSKSNRLFNSYILILRGSEEFMIVEFSRGNPPSTPYFRTPLVAITCTKISVEM